MPLLVRTPIHRETESFLGFVLRVSETNGYDTPWHIYRLAGLNQGQMDGVGLPGPAIARILGLPDEALDKITYTDTSDSRNYKILGHSLGKSFRDGELRLSKPRICPQCIAESGYIDAFWDLRAAIACPIHARRAIDVCPSCGGALSWFRPGLLTCRCGARLHEVKSERIGPELQDLMRLVYAKLHSRELINFENTSGLPVEALAPIPLKDLLWLVANLGSFTRSDLAPAETSALILANWPNGYYKYLERLGMKLGLQDSPSGGLRKQFESFYTKMFRRRPERWRMTFLQEEFVRFGTERWGKACVDPKLMRGLNSDGDRRFVSKTEFARKHRIWKPTLDRMIAAGEIATAIVGRGSKHRVVVDTQISQQPVAADALIGVREASALVGLPVSVLKQLRSRGVYRVTPHKGQELSWYLEDLRSFVQDGRRLIRPNESTDVATRTLASVMRLKFRDTTVKADFVTAVLEGKISVLGSTGENLAGLLLNDVEADKAIQALRAKAQDDSYSIQTCAEVLGVDFGFVSAAIGEGLLNSVRIGKYRRIPLKDAEAFKQRFISLRLLARDLETTVSRLLRLCKANALAVQRLAPQGLKTEAMFLVPDDAKCLKVLVQATVAEREARRSARKGCAARYESALIEYLDDLSQSGQSIPLRGGKPNRAVIARRCGFGRNAFYGHSPVRAILNGYVTGHAGVPHPPRATPVPV